jgi:hypothetical protein
MLYQERSLHSVGCSTYFPIHARVDLKSLKLKTAIIAKISLSKYR